MEPHCPIRIISQSPTNHIPVIQSASKMFGPEEPNSGGLLPKSKGPQVVKKAKEGDEEEAEAEAEEERVVEALIMDFDDLDGSWPLDQVSSVSNHNDDDKNNNQYPMSPLYLSCSDQGFSPLWAVLDGNDDVSYDTSAPPVCSALLPGTTIPVAERPVVNNFDNSRLPSLLMGLTPQENQEGSFVIKERMTVALRYFKDLTEQNVLAQFWVPIKNGSRYVLTTSGQPFVLDPHSNGLNQYRMVSQMYEFPVDDDNDGLLGLPGRVFCQRVPEWTPNVQYYSMLEYQRRNHAQNFNVQGSLALPIFEPSGQSCVGVLELILTSAKINYAPEVDKVCKALEAVNLKSSQILDHPNTQICNEGRQIALAEILGILTAVCETHKLPLAQTWVPCRHRNILAYGGGLKKSCSSFDGSCMAQICMSTPDVALYVVDSQMWRFREACVQHHLKKGQGVAGRAFLSRSSCFCGNITRFCKTNYPLVHYARMFGLAGCFAICLRSTHTGDDDYILEFFLPPRITDFYEQQILLGSLLATMEQHFQSLKVASDIELEEEVSVEIVQVSEAGVDSRLESIRIPLSTKLTPRPDDLPDMGDMVQDSPKQQLMVSLDDINDKGTDVKNGGGSINNFSSLDIKEMKNKSQRKRGKTEKSISLEVLQQYFAGSLKDAAKSLGVCPTTMKRICRQHGISRWPSRKINKVNRSLTKLKRVIESVQGAEGAFSLNSLNPSPLPVRSNQQTSPCFKHSEPHEKNDSPTRITLKSDEHDGMEDLLQGRRNSSPEKLVHDHIRSPPEVGKGSNGSKARSGSCEESAGTPTSHGSCQGSPPVASTTLAKHLYVSSINDQCVKAGDSPELAYPPTGLLNTSAAYSLPDALLMTEPQERFRGMLIEDAGSSKDLRNLCPSVADAVLDEQTPEFCLPNPPCLDMAPNQSMPTLAPITPHVTARKEMKSVTIKATYKEDIIRFRISLSSGILELQEEVAKRLKLEVGTFDIKYLDDDHEWVLIACDADLQECMDIPRSSGSNIIRLLVQDTISNLGSSCESSWD
ncbi:protein NLP6 [Carya illinoinensis]|nr:protein NLP6 [Carya illinoinensis]